MQSIIHDILAVLTESVDNQEIKAAEAKYQELLAQNPADEFVAALFNESLLPGKTQGTALVLLRKDVDSSKPAIRRVTDHTIHRQGMIAILHAAASNPNSQMASLISSYSLNEALAGRKFPELSAFLWQGLESSSERVQEMVSLLMNLLSGNFPKDREALGIDFLPLLEKIIAIQSDSVARYGVVALGNLCVNNEDEDGKQMIPPAMIEQLCRVMLMRTAQALERQSEHGTLMLQAVENLVQHEGEGLGSVVPEVLQLCQQILNADMSETIQCMAVRTFGSVASACLGLRAQLRQSYVSVLRELIIPRVVMSDQQIQHWLDQETDVTFEDNSIQAVAERAIENVATGLGRQVLIPILQDLCKQAQGSQQALYAAIIAIVQTGSAIGDVIKAKEIEQFIDLILSGLRSQNPRIRFEALNAISVFSRTEPLQNKIRKNHRTIIPALLAALKEPIQKIWIHVSTAMVNYIVVLQYEDLYEHLDQIRQVITASMGENLLASANALSMLAHLCQTIDENDISPLLLEFMPGVLERFQIVVPQTILSAELNFEQTGFLESIIDLVSQAAAAVPRLFEGCLGGITDGLMRLLEKTVQQEENTLFEGAMQAVSQLCEAFPTEMTDYIDRVLPLIEIILRRTLITKAELMADQEVEFRSNLMDQQEACLDFLALFMTTNPTVFVTRIQRVDELISSFTPYRIGLMTSRIAVMAATLGACLQNGQNPQELHQKYFKPLVGFLEKGEYVDEESMPLRLSEVEFVGEFMDSFSNYFEQYLKMYKAFGSPDFDEVVSFVFRGCKTIFSQCYELHQKAKQEDLQIFDDRDEQEAAQEERQEDWKNAVEAFGLTYHRFFEVLGESTPVNILQELQGIAVEWLNVDGTDEEFACVAEEGVGLFLTAAQHLSPEQTKVFWEPGRGKMGEMMCSLPDDSYESLRTLMFSFFMYLRKTADQEVAGSPVLLSRAVGLLDSLKEDGSAEAMGAFDNACSFLTISGKIAGQGPEFWKSMLRYCSWMDADSEEVARVVEFFLDEAVTNNNIGSAGQLLIDTIVKLFFGKFHAEILKLPEGQRVAGKIRSFAGQYGAQMKAAARNGGPFVQKNFSSFK